MNLSEKITRERKKLGLSQEQVAEKLGITRQSVSKWEAGSSIPEISKLIALSELFHVSIDYLVKDYVEEDAGVQNDTYKERERRAEENQRLEEKVDSLTRYMKGYQFTSKTKIAGIPLVSVRFSRYGGRDSIAKGIFAIGNIAIGVVSLGAVSVGFLSFGALAVGILAVAAGAFGLISFGAYAFGILAVGTATVGIYSAGVAAYGKEIAVGVAAIGKTAIGETVQGEHCLVWYEGICTVEIERFLNECHPELWKPLKELLIIVVKHIQM